MCGISFHQFSFAAGFYAAAMVKYVGPNKKRFKIAWDPM